MVLPCASVIVIIVLLNEALTCATPETMFLRSRRRTRVASLAMRSILQARPSFQALGIGGWRPGPRPVGDAGAVRRSFGLLLLAGDRLCLALARACVGVRALSAHRQAAAVAQA